jgi:small-conductance mechanosensitive channel
MEFLNIFSGLSTDILNIINTIVILAITFFVFNLILGRIKKGLLKKAKKKRTISNIEIFFKIIKYSFFFMLILIAISSLTGSWTGLGLSVGLFSAALGWALQKPITGVAAWIMVVARRPFNIGDRVIIGNIKGDLQDITLTHIYVREIGGIVPGEETSGRIIMIPNSVLFEQNIINYTAKDEYTLDQVSVTITFESNLNKAVKIALESAKKCTKKFIENVKNPYIRTYFRTNGISVHVRYFAPADELQKYSSDITQEIFKRITKTKDIEISYPHRKIFIKKSIHSKGN